MTTTNVRLRSLASLLVASSLLAVPAVADAAGRTPVDPATIRPTLNPTFSWSCWRYDSQTVCDGTRHDEWVALDTEFRCAGQPVYSTGTDDRTLRRWGDAEGRALRTHGTATIRETLSLQPDMSGTTARGIGQFSERYQYLVPGDLASRIVAISGIDATVTLPGAGVVFHDVGVKAFDIEDNVLYEHGPKDVLDDGIEAAFDQLCQAFLDS